MAAVQSSVRDIFSCCSPSWRSPPALSFVPMLSLLWVISRSDFLIWSSRGLHTSMPGLSS